MIIYYIAKFSLKPTNVSETINDEKTLSISPNPTSDFIEIKGNIGAHPKGNEASPIASENIQIFDMLGIIISTQSAKAATLQKGELRMDISKLSPGIYFIKIGNRVEKFVTILNFQMSYIFTKLDFSTFRRFKTFGRI